MKRIPFTPEQRKAHAAEASRRNREWLKTLSPEEKAERKQNAAWAKEDRANDKKHKAALREQKQNNKHELNILKFMLKNDVMYFHHGSSESMKKTIQKQIDYLIKREEHTEYDPYIWNYYGKGKNRMSLCLLGCLWSGPGTIYDVPLDGTYKFHIYDSGQRGLGSFNRITATKVENAVVVPHVDPGAFIPITAN